MAGKGIEKRNSNKKVAKAVVARAQKAKKKNKVVEVKLAASKKVKKPAAKTVTKAVRQQAVNAKKTANKEGKQATIAGLATKVDISQILNPSQKILKPFRQAAKVTKQKVRELAKKNKKQAGFLAKSVPTAKGFNLDLRIHTQASEGFFTMGSFDPGSAVARLAKVKRLDLIAITDYYQAASIDIVRADAERMGVKVLPGVDLCCAVGVCKEIQMTALFPEHFASADVYSLLEELSVPKEVYGRKDYCLNLDIVDVIRAVEGRGGILIPSRVDKTPYRELAIRELVETYGFHAFDLVHPESPEYFRAHWPQGGFTFFGFSNAFSLAQIGNRGRKVRLEDCCFEGLKKIVQRRVPLETLAVSTEEQAAA